MDNEGAAVNIESETSIEDVQTAEIEAQAETAQVETATDAAVQIAEIEANKEIILAEINSEVRIAEAEAYSNQDQSTWQQNIETQITDLTATVATLATLLTPPILEQQEQSQSPQSNPDDGASVPTLDSPEMESQQPVQEQPKPCKKSRWI